MKKSAIVLEGGAMRGVYTSAVLDVLMENNIDVDCLVGVSAGALNGMNYISKQKGRSKKINIDFCDNSKYIGIKAIKKNHGIVGFDYLFGEISNKLIPFDFKTFNESEKRFVVGATNCRTGKTEFFEKKESEDILKIAQASSSMPLASDFVKIKEDNYLDGAIECNIPIQWALDEGYEKIIVILTRDINYKKEPISKGVKKIYEVKYKKYPNLIKTLNDKSEKYNELQKKINELEKQGKICVVRPTKPITISRLEKNKEKLEELYEEGIKDANNKLNEIEKYLKN